MIQLPLKPLDSVDPDDHQAILSTESNRAVMSWHQLTWCAAGVALGAALLGGLGHRDSPSARDAPGEP